MGFSGEFPPGTDPALIAILECLRDIKENGFGNKPLILSMVRESDCAPVLVSVPCDDAGGWDFQNNEVVTMSGLIPAVASDANNTFGEAQVKFKLIGAAAATAGEIIEKQLEGIVIPNPVNPALEPTPVTIDMICDYSVTALPCKAVCLKDPLDVESGFEVEADGSYLDGVQIRSDGDPAKGGVDLEAPFAQVENGVSVWCPTFRAEFDKNGVLVKVG